MSVLLAGEESELVFIDFATADLSVSLQTFIPPTLNGAAVTVSLHLFAVIGALPSRSFLKIHPSEPTICIGSTVRS